MPKQRYYNMLIDKAIQNVYWEENMPRTGYCNSGMTAAPPQ